MVLAPSTSFACLLSMESFSQRISLIRVIRNAETRENSQRRPNNNNVVIKHAAAAKSLQSWPTLCDPIDGSPLGSPAPRILQARTLEWVAISFSNA